MFVIFVIITMEHFWFSFKMLKYTKKKYLKSYKNLKTGFSATNNIPYFSEIFRNNHKNDKKYSNYILISRLNLMVFFVIFVFFCLLLI